MVDGPVMPAPAAPPGAEVVAEEVAKADSRVDLVIRVFWRLLGVDEEWFAARLSSAWARDRTFKRRRW